MSIVNVETGELIEPMSEDAARRLTERIRIAAANFTEAKDKILSLVDEAKAGSAHIALGYKSWAAYLTDVLSDEPLRLAREDRRELVTRLADEGMSTRAIAPIVGAHHTTVAADLSTVGNPTVEPAPAARETQGLDGRTRTYAAPATRQAQRDDAEVLLNLVQSLADRAARQAEKLTPAQIARVTPKAALWTGGLRESLETLERLLTSLTEEK